MSGLKALRNRIKSVTATRKITRAMNMVAASKMKKMQKLAFNAREYSKTVVHLLASAALIDFSNLNGFARILFQNHLSNKISTINKPLYILIGSDRGLCGAFNSSMAKEVKKNIITNANACFAIFGKKVLELLKPICNDRILNSYEGYYTKEFEYINALIYAKELIKLIQLHNFDGCYVIFNSFESVLSQKIKIKQIAPFDYKSNDKGLSSRIIEAESNTSNANELLNHFAEFYFASILYGALAESLLSEQAARMNAMDSASKNAGDMIKKLNLLYNRTRQANITRELIEIISGAEALQ